MFQKCITYIQNIGSPEICVSISVLDGDRDGGGMGMETVKVGERGLEMVHVEGRWMRIVKVLVKVGIPNVELSLGG